MSDFLDRVAARAVGSEAMMLSPRLPSLFEPAGRGAAAVVEESLQVPAAVPTERTFEPEPADARQSERKTGRAEASVPALVPRQAKEVSGQAAPRERVVVVDERRLPAPHLASPREPSAEPVMSRTQSRNDRMQAGELQPVRETHILRERIAAATPRDEHIGALLPPAQPVFATRHEPEARATHPARKETQAGALADAPRESREPVVHVSIGRLEVRAASASAPAPRRQEAPRPSALDDYLRQRGGGAS